MYIKLHKSYRVIVAICDTELIGKIFEEPSQKGTKQLDVRENFYKDKEVSHEEAVKLLQTQSSEDSTFSIVGPKAIKAALEAKIINEQGIGKIDNIPYALVLL